MTLMHFAYTSQIAKPSAQHQSTEYQNDTMKLWQRYPPENDRLNSQKGRGLATNWLVLTSMGSANAACRWLDPASYWIGVLYAIAQAATFQLQRQPLKVPAKNASHISQQLRLRLNTTLNGQLFHSTWSRDYVDQFLIGLLRKLAGKMAGFVGLMRWQRAGAGFPFPLDPNIYI